MCLGAMMYPTYSGAPGVSATDLASSSLELFGGRLGAALVLGLGSLTASFIAGSDSPSEESEEQQEAPEPLPAGTMATLEGQAEVKAKKLSFSGISELVQDTGNLSELSPISKKAKRYNTTGCRRLAALGGC
eukprot:TRINITY_DN78551_c0_g1_i1.p1 TRINITY_DN78551_c0_g1~~TRINITY_DN78551_c0_g1_i1.p1  ORF type:complete len:132 (+),score=29.26 TRINITY_DN78551_c0_g1_i1:171-566(+)